MANQATRQHDEHVESYLAWQARQAFTSPFQHAEHVTAWQAFIGQLQHAEHVEAALPHARRELSRILERRRRWVVQFRSQQNKVHRFVCFSEIIVRYARTPVSIKGDSERRKDVVDVLTDAIFSGEFDRGGRIAIWLIDEQSGVVRMGDPMTWRRITKAFGHVFERVYLRHSWVSAEMAREFCRRYQVEADPDWPVPPVGSHSIAAEQIVDQVEQASATPAAGLETRPKAKRGPKPLDKQDKVALDKIGQMVASGEAKSANEAATKLVAGMNIAGHGTDDSKIRRLGAKYNKQLHGPLRS